MNKKKKKSEKSYFDTYENRFYDGDDIFIDSFVDRQNRDELDIDGYETLNLEDKQLKESDEKIKYHDRMKDLEDMEITK